MYKLCILYLICWSMKRNHRYVNMRSRRWGTLERREPSLRSLRLQTMKTKCNISAIQLHVQSHKSMPKASIRPRHLRRDIQCKTHKLSLVTCNLYRPHCCLTPSLLFSYPPIPARSKETGTWASPLTFTVPIKARTGTVAESAISSIVSNTNRMNPYSPCSSNIHAIFLLHNLK